MWNEKKSALYDAITGKNIDLEQPQHIIARSFSGDGSRLAVASTDGSIVVYECPSYDDVIKELDLPQAIYVYNKLQKQEQSMFHRASNALLLYFSSSDAFAELHQSLPLTFKKLVE